MKFLDKLTLILYSWIILIIAGVICMLIFGWIDIQKVGGFVLYLLNRETSSQILLGVSIVCILLSLKAIFFSSFRVIPKKMVKEYY